MNTQGKSPIDLRQAVNHLNALPALPVVAQKLLALKLDTDRDEQQMLSLISQDPLISAKLIGLANSPLVGAAKKISAVKDASMLLGLKRVQSVATGIALMSQMNQPIGRLDLQGLWMHNMGVAFSMLSIIRFMPARHRPPEDQTFLAGMLHDVGYMVLAYLDPDRSDELLVRMAMEPERLAMDIEREVASVTHDELGAELARHWGLPAEIVEVIRYHHRSDSIEAATHPLARVISLAEKLLSEFGIHEQISPFITDNEWHALGIDPGKAEEITNHVNEQAEQASHFASSFG
jgi:putative nucleotidyltransferase with HDIG domain